MWTKTCFADYVPCPFGVTKHVFLAHLLAFWGRFGIICIPETFGMGQECIDTCHSDDELGTRARCRLNRKQPRMTGNVARLAVTQSDPKWAKLPKCRSLARS